MGEILKVLSKLAHEHGPKMFYPGLPFFGVPIVVASMILAQFSSLTHYPSDSPAALSLGVKVSSRGEAAQLGSLLIIPRDASFFLRNAHDGISSVWISMREDKIESNRDILKVTPDGLQVRPLNGVSYPLALVVEGEHAPFYDPTGGKRQELGKLELVTVLSNWVVFFLLAGAVFSFGVSTRFLDDAGIVDEQNTA